MLKGKLSIRRTGVEETPPPDPGFTTPITPATPSHYREGLEVATFASHREEDTVSVAPAFSFPNLAIPSTPQANFSRVPFGVQVQLQLQQLKIGNDGAAAAAAGTPNLREGVVSFKPRESYINYPSTSLEETKRPFKSIDSSSEDDLTLTPILPLDGWVIDLPPERYFRHASGSPYLQPRMAKLFDDDIGKASVWMW